MKSKESEVRKKIVDILKKSSEPISKREIARFLRISPATASKYVDILNAEGRIDVKNYGNINLVKLKREKDDSCK